MLYTSPQCDFPLERSLTTATAHYLRYSLSARSHQIETVLFLHPSIARLWVSCLERE
jgi:hypothetical protein